MGCKTIKTHTRRTPKKLKNEKRTNQHQLKNDKKNTTKKPHTHTDPPSLKKKKQLKTHTNPYSFKKKKKNFANTTHTHTDTPLLSHQSQITRGAPLAFGSVEDHRSIARLSCFVRSVSFFFALDVFGDFLAFFRVFHVFFFPKVWNRFSTCIFLNFLKVCF